MTLVTSTTHAGIGGRVMYDMETAKKSPNSGNMRHEALQEVNQREATAGVVALRTQQGKMAVCLSRGNNRKRAVNRK